MQNSASPRRAVNALFISDVHLGSRHCKADYLLSFLQSVEADVIYLVGDIIDLWALKSQWFWPELHTKVLQTLTELAESGTRVVYVPGNHDSIFRGFRGNVLGEIEVQRQAVHVTADGKRMLITHGDEFEHLISVSWFSKLVGNLSYELLLMMNRVCNSWRAWRGKPYWSLACYIKNRVNNARQAIEGFEEAAAHKVAHQGYDGVVCGHIHQACVREIDGTLYCNDGDWVDTCSALVENEEGQLELLHWSDIHSLICEAEAQALPAAGVNPILQLVKGQQAAGEALADRAGQSIGKAANG